MRRLAHILALSFGAGLSPVWPGTVGAAVGLLFAAALLPLAPALQAGLLAALLLVGIWSSAIVAADTGEDDPQIVVIDESPHWTQIGPERIFLPRSNAEKERLKEAKRVSCI